MHGNMYVEIEPDDTVTIELRGIGPDDVDSVLGELGSKDGRKRFATNLTQAFDMVARERANGVKGRIGFQGPDLLRENVPDYPTESVEPQAVPSNGDVLSAMPQPNISVN